MGKFITKIIAAAVIGIAFTFGADAQHLTDVQMDSTLRSHRLIFFGDSDTPHPSQDSTLKLIQKFYIDQFRHFSDPLAPYFLFMSKDSKLAMGIGGCVRMRGYYDWGGAIPASGFAPYLIPMEKNPLRERYLGTTPSGTALFFRVIGSDKSFGEYQLYIEANFNGYGGRDFHLKKAYAVINDLTIGYANSSFSDPGALPPTVDAQGPNCKMSATSVLVRWMHNFPKGFTVALSAETPSDQIDVVEGKTAKVEQYVPDFAGFAQYSWMSGSHVRVSGILRSLPYRNLITQRNHTVEGWGVQLSGVVRFAERFTAYGCFNMGNGYASLGGDWLMGNYDLVADPAQEGKLYAPRAFGYYGSLQYNILPNLFVSATAGGASYRPAHTPLPTEYSDGLYLCGNIYWNLTARIQAAAEFNLGRRENFDHESRWARRVGLMAQFSF